MESEASGRRRETGGRRSRIRSLRLSSSSDVDVLTQLEDDVVQEALRSGKDLREYSKDVEEELKKVELDAVKDYIKEAEQIASLHSEIGACDQVLQRMEEMLAGFQADLGSISSEIQSLQEQSVEMNVKLKNRQGVRGELGQFVDDIVVADQMIRAIMETPVTEREFLEQLHELQHKITFIKQQEFREAKAAADVRQVVDNLRIKAVEKIREFLLLRINQFKRPLANYQVPQNAMLKFRFYYEFLVSNERQVAKEVRDEYVETLSKMFFSYFKTYANRLMRLQLEDVATREDVLGAEDAARASGLFSSRPAIRNRATVFSIGTRNVVLGPELDAPVVVPHAAQQNSQKFHYEVLFRSLEFSLVEHVCHEYLFLSDFFLATGQAALDLFALIMGKAIAAITKTIEDYISGSFDAIALFLCIHLVQKYRTLMQKRNVPALERHWELVLGLLWPRFDYVMSLHTESVRLADPSKMEHVDSRPHYIVRRYAELSAALVGVNEGAPEERCERQLVRLRAELEQFVAKLAAGLRSERKRQLVCLINNYDLVLSVLAERTLEESGEARATRALLAPQTEAFVEELLFPYFGALISFVKDCDPLVDQGQAELLRRYTDKVPNLVQSFGVEWRHALKEINGEVMTSFTNFKNGTNILQTALTQLIQYYHRFHKILGHPVFASCPARNQLVNIHHIMVEVKKYKPTF